MTTKLLLWLITGGVVAIVYYALKTNRSISSQEARQLVENGARLLDVRTEAEYAEGHLPNAINLPVQELHRRLAELSPKERPIVVYCQSGYRSAQAAKILAHAGFSAVHDLGGKDRW